MGLDLDFGGGTKAAAGFAVLPKGTYDAVIDEVTVKDTNAKEGVEQEASDGTQAQYLNPKYKIVGGDYDGRFVWGINSIRFPKDALDDEKKERETREIFLAWLNLVTGTDFGGGNTNLNLNNLVGAKVRIVVTQSEWQGNPKNDVNRVLAREDSDSAIEAARRAL